MKIIIFTSFYGNGYGLGYSALKESEEFIKAGHSVTVVCINKNPHNNLNKKIKFIHLPKINGYFLVFIDYFFKLKKIISENKINDYDIIYIQSLEFGLLNFSKIKKPIFYFSRSTMKGVYNCYKEYGIDFSFKKRLINIILQFLEYRLFNNSQIIFVKSNLMLNEIKNLYNILTDKIKVIYGGIDNKDFKYISSKKETGILKRHYKLDNIDNILVYAGRITPHKGLLYLIRALKLLKSKNFYLLIAGKIDDYFYYKKALKIIKSKSLNNKVKFLGHVNQSEIYKILNIASVVITPSLYEPFGMINLQAAFLNRPIVTTFNVGSNEILHNYKNKLIVDAASNANLSKAIDNYILNKSDLAKVQNLNKYSWPRVAEKIIYIFKKYSKKN